MSQCATKMSNNNDDLYIKPFRTNGMFLALKVYRFIDNKFMLMMGAAFLPGIATLTNRSIGCIEKGGTRR